MDYNTVGLTYISTQFQLFTGWRQLYTDQSNTMLAADSSGYSALFYIDSLSLTSLGQTAGTTTYISDLIIDISLPLSSQNTGLRSESLTDEDKLLVSAIIQPVEIAHLIIGFFDPGALFIPPAPVLGEFLTTVGFRFLKQDQPRLLRAGNRMIVRYHIEWKLNGLGF